MIFIASTNLKYGVRPGATRLEDAILSFTKALPYSPSFPYHDTKILLLTDDEFELQSLVKYFTGRGLLDTRTLQENFYLVADFPDSESKAKYKQGTEFFTYFPGEPSESYSFRNVFLRSLGDSSCEFGTKAYLELEKRFSPELLEAWKELDDDAPLRVAATSKHANALLKQLNNETLNTLVPPILKDVNAFGVAFDLNEKKIASANFYFDQEKLSLVKERFAGSDENLNKVFSDFGGAYFHESLKNFANSSSIKLENNKLSISLAMNDRSYSTVFQLRKALQRKYDPEHFRLQVITELSLLTDPYEFGGPPWHDDYTSAPGRLEWDYTSWRVAASQQFGGPITKKMKHDEFEGFRPDLFADAEGNTDIFLVHQTVVWTRKPLDGFPKDQIILVQGIKKWPWHKGCQVKSEDVISYFDSMKDGESFNVSYVDARCEKIVKGKYSREKLLYRLDWRKKLRRERGE